MKVNYNEEMKNILNNLNGTKKLLLHSCCGPCSSAVIEKLTNYFDITVLYYNPNIEPKAEYEKRKKEQIRFIKEYKAVNKIDFMDCDYDNEAYSQITKGYEKEKEGGLRCHRCYKLRLEKTCQIAKENNYDFFGTTLTVSPYKNAQVLNEIGAELEKKYNINYLFSDFKKENGYLRSTQIAKQYKLYRQNYCGCHYSNWQEKENMNIIDIITKKRDKKELNENEIKYFVDEYTAGNIPDYQASALLMAIYLNGMSEKETFDLTKTMINSGDILTYDGIAGKIVDKHSTGGIGDKTSLIIVPIAASLGCKVAKMSGRGLGFTGGTADKLESIRNYQVELTIDEFKKAINDVGGAMIYKTGNIAPADKKIYALRDVTGTVESIPLIASSIMSKKIALGADVIVLDVKVGKGAFMKSYADAKKLAEMMIKIGKYFNKKVYALLTNMDVPLGYAVGNKLEVMEAYKVLAGEEEGPLKDICVELATYMVKGSFAISYDEARKKVIDAIDNHDAIWKFKDIIENQNGDYESVNQLEVSNIVDITAKKTGYIASINAEDIGRASMLLGAGRQKLDDQLDYNVGVLLAKTTGDKVTKGEILARLFINDKKNVAKAQELVESAIEISKEKVEKQKLIFEVLD